jgi:hypothetical protein
MRVPEEAARATAGPIHGGEVMMSDDKRDILDVLKFELSFLEQGGYGRSVRTPRKPTSIFQDSLSCINFNDPGRPHPCSECLLNDFVPQGAQGESVPCHHIPLNPSGETVGSLERRNQSELEAAVKDWLRATIQRIEQERAKAAPSKS